MGLDGDLGGMAFGMGRFPGPGFRQPFPGMPRFPGQGDFSGLENMSGGMDMYNFSGGLGMERSLDDILQNGDGGMFSGGFPGFPSFPGMGGQGRMFSKLFDNHLFNIIFVNNQFKAEKG